MAFLDQLEQIAQEKRVDQPRHTAVTVDEALRRRSFEVLLPMMETENAAFLSQDAAVWQENIDWLQKVGMIDAAFDPAEVMVDLLAE